MSLRKPSLNERLRRGGRKQRLGLEAPNYLVVGIRESVLEETTVTPLRPGLIDALISWRAWHSAPQSPYPLAQLGLGMIRSSLGFTRLRTSVSYAERLSHFGGDQLGIAFVAIWPRCK